MNIPVYIVCDGDPKSDNVAKLVSLFSADRFDIFIVDTTQAGGNKLYNYALQHAKDNYNGSPCVIIKDCMFSNLSSNTMNELINEVTSDCCTGYKICYLSRYLDTCDGSIVQGSIVTTKYAKGDDAILYFPEARDILMEKLTENSKKKPSDILSHLIKKDVNAVAISPPALQYNPSFGDLIRTWECNTSHKPPQPSNNTSYAWLVIIPIILIIILIVWLCWR